MCKERVEKTRCFSTNAMSENSKSFVDRKNIKQRNLSESETKYFVRNHDKNAGISIFRARDEGTSVLGEIYNAGNHCRSKERHIR